ncbi:MULTISPECIES: hypothetical protein [Halorussus]|uniref:DUF7266 family protein n=1 Tax=Halorussus TaxID=1070314 RepID=UPI000E211127|nr:MULTISPECIES: hypothetical protein [Halorussus]NHN58346.1 hypothetical protein [Halorussus sp. JP-T4]
MRGASQRGVSRGDTGRLFARDDRGVSTALGYVLNLTVATLVVTGLLVASGGIVEDQRKQTVRSELRVVGQQFAADLSAADELAATANAGDTVRIERRLPREVAGRSYTVDLVEPGPGQPCPGETCLVLTATGSDVTVALPLALEISVASSSTNGGRVSIRYADPDADSTYELEVADD